MHWILVRFYEMGDIRVREMGRLFEGVEVIIENTTAGGEGSQGSFFDSYI